MSAGHFWIVWCCTWLAGRVLGRRVNGGAVAYPWIVALLQADSQPRLGTLLLISSPLLPPPSHPILSSPPNTLLVPLQPPPHPGSLLGSLAQMYRRVSGCKTIYIFPLSGQVGFLLDTFTGKPFPEHIVSVLPRRGGGKVASHRVALGPVQPREVYSSAWDVQGDKLYDLSPLGRC